MYSSLMVPRCFSGRNPPLTKEIARSPPCVHILSVERGQVSHLQKLFFTSQLETLLPFNGQLLAPPPCW